MPDLIRPEPPKNLEEARAQIDGLRRIVTELKTQNDEVRELSESIGKRSRNASRARSLWRLIAGPGPDKPNVVLINSS